MAPTLFKIYIEDTLKNWKRKCSPMGIQVGTDTIYSLLFADDQVVIASDNDDASYMMRNLNKVYEQAGLSINTKKTQYMATGNDNADDLEIGRYKIKQCSSFKYLGVTLTTNGKSSEDINNKIGQGRAVIGQINSLLWNKKISNKTKTSLYKCLVEPITTYGAETWELRKRDKDRLLALEMDFWRRSAGISRLDHIRNDDIRRTMGTEETIIDTIERKRLAWYGHLERMNEDRWPKKVWRWIPPGRRKRGRPLRRWKMDVREAMDTKGLQEGDWEDRQLWRLRSEKRQLP